MTSCPSVLLAQLHAESKALTQAGLALGEQRAAFTLWRKRSPANWARVRTPLGTGRCIAEVERGPAGVRCLMEVPMVSALVVLRALAEEAP